MKINHHSFFKNPDANKAWFKDWVRKLENQNNKTYEQIEVNTSLGKTQVYGLNLNSNSSETLVIFPGARTSSLFWDLDNGLKILKDRFKIFLIETNGLPNLSDGYTPDIHSLAYGSWASEVLDSLKIKKTFVAGASFGALICMKLCLVDKKRVKAAFLLNPGCLQPFSLTLKNLYYNLLPIVFPIRKSVQKFIDKAIFFKPYHKLTKESEELLIAYEIFALTEYSDNTQKPYYMEKELREITTDTYVLLGENDLLFPPQQSRKNAQQLLTSLKDLVILPNTGHGIETSALAIAMIFKWAYSYHQPQNRPHTYDSINEIHGQSTT